jgi:hypothetical protein
MTRALRSRLPVSLALPLAWFTLLGATHCGGEAQSTAGANAGGSGSDGAGHAGETGVVSGGDSGMTGSAGAGASTSACHSPLSTPVGRPQAVACAATALGALVASSSTCTIDSDCSDAGSDMQCLRGKCSIDGCLADSDCPSGNACQCSSQLRGDVESGNSCVPTGCRVDADCGPGGACSPDTSGHCGSVVGYQCHSAADTCHSDADCCGNTPQCGYQPELAHWACAAITVCSG